MSVSLSYSFASKSLPPKPTAYGMAIIATLLLGGAAFLAYSTHEFQQRGVRSTGIVTSLERSESSFFPVFEYSDNAGRLFEVRSRSSSRDYVPGDQIPVIYDPERPLDARVDDPVGLYVLPGVLFILAIAFYGGAVLILKVLPFFEAAYDRDRARKEAANRS